MAHFNDLKLGSVLNIANEPYQVVFAQHIKVARGGAVLKTKLKNLLSGNTLEKTFSGADDIVEADLSYRQANFLYEEGAFYFFMDNQDFEQFQFAKDIVGEAVKYLKEGQTVSALVFNQRPVAIALPPKVVLSVVSAPEGVKGNSAGAATKVVVLENGLEVRTPMFIKNDDQIIINTETGEYVARA